MLELAKEVGLRKEEVFNLNLTIENLSSTLEVGGPHTYLQKRVTS